MTTIATDGKTMAGDGISTIAGTIIRRACKKVERLSDGSLFGAAGDSCQGKLIRNWLNDGADPAKWPEIKQVTALHLRLDGVVVVYDDMSAGLPDEVDLPAAIGSGEQIALGAMDAGASPEQAIYITIKRNPHTGGEVSVMSLAQ